MHGENYAKMCDISLTALKSCPWLYMITIITFNVYNIYSALYIVHTIHDNYYHI